MYVKAKKIAPQWVGKQRLLIKEVQSLSSLCDRCAKYYCTEARYTAKTDKIVVVKCSGYRKRDCENCSNGTLISKKQTINSAGIPVGKQYIRCRLHKTNVDKKSCCNKHIGVV